MNSPLKLVQTGFALIVCLYLSLIELHAAPPKLVKDLVPGVDMSSSSNPSNFLKVGDVFYFSAHDSMGGMELWKSDGTEAGTVLVKDLHRGDYSSPSNFAAIGNTLYFLAYTEDTGLHGLWRSDGTAAGTFLVTGNFSSPALLTEVNGILYFTAMDGIHGKELWKSDGTFEGTVMVKDIATGSASSSPLALTTMDSVLYFRASDGVNGIELWKSDGTEAGTVLIQDINPGTGASNPASLRAIGQTLFFTATNGTHGIELWKSDGTTAGTAMVKDISPTGSSTPSGLVEFEDCLYFAATDGANGVELWTSDGTEAGTFLLKDIWPGSSGSSPSLFTVAGTNLYFCSTSDSATGNELWKTDGTQAGTVLVKNIKTSGSSSPSSLTSNGNDLYFAATGDSQFGNRHLWKTDGTSEGTAQVSNLGSPNPTNIFAFQGNVYFSGIQGTYGRELWKSDGSVAGTALFKDICHIGQSEEYFSLTRAGAVLFFDNGNSVWRTDGALERTVPVAHLPTFRYFDFVNWDNTYNLRYFEGLQKFYFLRDNEDGSTGLWKSDGSETGTVLVRNLQTDSQTPELNTFVEAGPRLFFVTSRKELITPDSGKLWVSMGTPETTHIILGAAEGEYGDQPNPSDLTAVGNILYFFANGPDSERSLWKSDGTEAGTMVVKNFGVGANVGQILAASGGVYFFADDGLSGPEPWWSDGTSNGTHKILDVIPGIDAGGAAEMIIFQNELYFITDDGIHGEELWNESGLVKDINIGISDGHPQSLTLMNGLLYFRANDGIHGFELWRSDGTTAGTYMVKDIRNGPETSMTFPGAVMGDLLYFVATDGFHGGELWQSDGTSEGTVMVADIAEGSAESWPSNLTVVGDHLYFTATTEEYGTELYFYNPSDTDGDWMPDDWEVSHGLNLSDELDALLDTDGDGQTNLAEYYAGTNPLLSSSYFATTITNPIAGEFQIEFTGVEDKKYSILFKDDLTSPNWQLLQQVQRPPEVPFGPYPITIQDSPPPGVTGRFYKVVTPAIPD